MGNAKDAVKDTVNESVKNWVNNSVQDTVKESLQGVESNRKTSHVKRVSFLDFCLMEV